MPACSNPGCGFDVDGDGLNDAWETLGIDLDCDTTLDLPPLMGAVVGVRDIYLEVDYLDAVDHSHAPSPGAMGLVQSAFAAQGIALHVDPVSDAIPEIPVITLGPAAPGCPIPPAESADFYDLKAAHFDHALNPAYHYAIFGHYATCDSEASCALCPDGVENSVTYGTTGLGEVLGNDLMVTLGWANDNGFCLADALQPCQSDPDCGVGICTFVIDLMGPAERELLVGGTMMHELGHNLGLDHSGDSEMPGREPNYISVMQQRLQTGIPFAAASGETSEAGRRLDYSGAALDPLDEAGGLDEADGLGAGTADITRFGCPGGSIVHGPAEGAIDWDCDGSLAGVDVSADPNGDSSLTLLTGHDDWSALDYSFQCSPTFVDGRPPEPHVAHDETALSQLYDERLLFPFLPVAIDVRPGVEPNFIQLGSPDTVPVAVLGGPSFDVLDVDVQSLRFAGAAPASSFVDDVDTDGHLDLIGEFSMMGLNFVSESTQGLLTGALQGTNQGIEGVDAVIVVDGSLPALQPALLSLLAGFLLALGLVAIRRRRVF